MTTVTDASATTAAPDEEGSEKLPDGPLNLIKFSNLELDRVDIQQVFCPDHRDKPVRQQMGRLVCYQGHRLNMKKLVERNRDAFPDDVAASIEATDG